MHSAKDPNTSTYTIFLYLAHYANYKNTIKYILATQLSSVQTSGLTTSMAELEALQVRENSDYLVTPEVDDKPFTSLTHAIHTQLNTCS